MRAFVLAEDIQAANYLSDGIRALAAEGQAAGAGTGVKAELGGEGAAAAGGPAEVAVIAHNEQLLQARADVAYRLSLPEGLMLEDSAQTLAALVFEHKPSVVLVQPTRQLRLLAGKAAALLGLAAIGQITAYNSDGSLQKMAYGGMAVRTEKATTATSIVFVPFGVLPEAEASGCKGSADTVAVGFITPTRTVRLLSSKAREKAAVDLSSAERIIGVGRGIAAREDMQVVEGLAAAIGAEIGCTRPIAEEEKWLPREVYIGVSGAMLAPQVYLAVGLSGQVQHTVGINRSQMIFAINKDRNAPIFKQADYGIVADLYKVVPALNEKLSLSQGTAGRQGNSEEGR